MLPVRVGDEDETNAAGAGRKLVEPQLANDTVCDEQTAGSLGCSAEQPTEELVEPIKGDAPRACLKQPAYSPGQLAMWAYDRDLALRRDRLHGLTAVTALCTQFGQGGVRTAGRSAHTPPGVAPGQSFSIFL